MALKAAAGHGTRGRLENESDPRRARVIADQVRLRQDLRVINPPADVDVDLRLLTGRRQELVCGQTRRGNRLRDLLCSIQPGLERRIDVTVVSLLHRARAARPLAGAR